MRYKTMLPIFNEYEYATDMNNGSSNDRSQDDPRLYKFNELVIYAKWLRWSLWASLPDGEEKDALVYNGLVTFCQQLLSGFNIDIQYQLILNVIKESKRYKLRSCNPSYITKSEWEQVLSIDNDRSRRLYFALLVLAKFYRNNPAIPAEPQAPREYKDNTLKIKIGMADLFKYANIKFSRAEITNNPKVKLDPFLYFKDSELLQVRMSNKYYTCQFILPKADPTPDPSSAFLTITDYTKLNEYYLYALNEPSYKICSSCGRAFKNKHGNTIYCNKCSRHLKTSDQYSFSICIDCGARFKKSIKDHKTIRCRSCRKKHIRQNNRLASQKYKSHRIKTENFSTNPHK